MTEPRAADHPRAGEGGSGPAHTGPGPAAVSDPETAAGAGNAEAGSAEVVTGEVVTDATAATPPAQDEQEPAEPIVIRDRRRVSATGEQPPGRDGEADRDEAGGAGPDSAPTPAGEPEATPAAGATTAEATVVEAAPDSREPERPAAADGLGAELEALRAELDDRTRDLQRLSAEYANYRKRVERDRSLVAEQATGSVLSELLPVLDDLDRAREHGDLVGPFGAVAEHLLATTAKLGLTAFGEQGDPFDPTHHEAVAHRTSDEVTEPTCVEVMRRGYLLGEKLLRPALVAVADPE